MSDVTVNWFLIGCHLETMYGGILLVDVGRDAND